MERAYEHVDKGVALGLFYKIVSSTFRSSTSIVRIFVKRALRKIETAGEAKSRQKNRYYDPIHDE